MLPERRSINITKYTVYVILYLMGFFVFFTVLILLLEGAKCISLRGIYSSVWFPAMTISRLVPLRATWFQWKKTQVHPVQEELILVNPVDSGTNLDEEWSNLPLLRENSS